MKTIRPIEWVGRNRHDVVPGFIRMLDQTRLPAERAYIETTDYRMVFRAIRSLAVRGAPAIGIAAAMGTAAAALRSRGTTLNAVRRDTLKAADILATSRPTAVNLFWALDRMRRLIRETASCNVDDFRRTLVREAIAIRDEDAAMCRDIGRHGVSLLRNNCTIITHCNAGALATAEFGTALAPVYTAAERGMRIHVISDETRPLLQGSRLTAWELASAGIDVTVICDNMAAHVMKTRRIHAVLVGADRIAANGDAANKIGTYALALVARAHRVPFYVLAPSSTFDPATRSGRDIPIEERASEEITCGFGRRTAPRNVRTFSPAFDVTPANLITAIVCEKGILRPDYTSSIRRMLAK